MQKTKLKQNKNEKYEKNPNKTKLNKKKERQTNGVMSQ